MGRGEGSKICQHLPTDRTKKIAAMGEGVVKNPEKIVDVFYGRSPGHKRRQFTKRFSH